MNPKQRRKCRRSRASWPVRAARPVAGASGKTKVQRGRQPAATPSKFGEHPNLGNFQKFPRQRNGISKVLDAQAKRRKSEKWPGTPGTDSRVRDTCVASPFCLYGPCAKRERKSAKKGYFIRTVLKSRLGFSLLRGFTGSCFTESMCGWRIDAENLYFPSSIRTKENSK